MVWFLVAPAAIYGAKKLWDAVKDSDSAPSTTSSYRATGIEDRKDARGRAIKKCFKDRKDRVKNLLMESGLSSKLGPVLLDTSGSDSIKVEFEGYAAAINLLNDVRMCLDDQVFEDESYFKMEISIPYNARLRDEMECKLEANYGQMSALNGYGEYNKSDDTFLRELVRLIDGNLGEDLKVDAAMRKSFEDSNISAG